MLEAGFIAIIAILLFVMIRIEFYTKIHLDGQLTGLETAVIMINMIAASMLIHIVALIFLAVMIFMI